MVMGPACRRSSPQLVPEKSCPQFECQFPSVSVGAGKISDMDNTERGPDRDPEEWASSGPEPNETGIPFGGVVPAGAMHPNGANPPVPLEERAAREAALQASDARQATHYAMLEEARDLIARGEALRAQALHAIRDEADVAAQIWVTETTTVSDIERAAQTEASQEVAARLRISKGAASALITEARFLVTELPATWQAVSCGEISYHHAQRIASHAGSLPPEVRRDFEDEVLPIAKKKTVTQAERKLKDVRERMHPESITERHIQAVEDRTVYLTGRPDGMVELTALLSAEDGVSAFGRISATAERLKSAEDPRTKPQRMADVFRDLLLTTSTPRHHRHRPHRAGHCPDQNGGGDRGGTGEPQRVRHHQPRRGPRPIHQSTQLPAGAG